MRGVLMTTWYDGVVISRSAPGHVMVEVEGRRYLLQHDPAVENRLSVGAELRVQTDKDYISAWSPALARGKQ